MGVDVNFNNVTYTITDTDGKLVSMGTILFNGLKRALLTGSLLRRYRGNIVRSGDMLRA